MYYKKKKQQNSEQSGSLREQHASHSWGPVRVNSDRRHGSETATWRGWNDDKQQAAHAKLRQRQKEKWNRQWLAAHSAHSGIEFYNKVKLSVSIDSLLCVFWLSSVIFSSHLSFHVTHYAFMVTRSTFSIILRRSTHFGNDPLKTSKWPWGNLQAGSLGWLQRTG